MRVKRERFLSPLTVEGYRIRLKLTRMDGTPKPFVVRHCYGKDESYTELNMTRTAAEQIFIALSKELYGASKSEPSEQV